MEICKNSKKFVKKYKLQHGELRLWELNQIACSFGYEIRHFDPNSPEQLDAFLKMKVDQSAISKKAFTYNKDSKKIIFIKTALEEDDEIFLLLHELGHIYLRHTSWDNLSDVEQERAANDFANQVLSYGKTKRTMKIIGVSAALVLGLAITGISASFLHNRDEQIPSSSPVVEATQSISPSPSPSPIAVNVVIPSEEPAVTSDEQDSVMVSVTKTGDKYHRSDCHYIVGRAIFTLSIEEATNAGYIACTYCRPDEL